MKIFVSLLLGVLAVLPLPVAAISGYSPVNIRMDATVQRGEVLLVAVDGPGITDVLVFIELPNGRRMSSQGSRIATGPDGMHHWQVLVGVDHGSPGGNARIETIVVTGDVAQRFIGATRIEQREFILEEIALNAAMSDLRQTEDPRRFRESEELWELLHIRNPHAAYHTGRFVLPVSEFRRTSGFGDRRLFHYTDGISSRGVHNGLDLAAPTGTPVVAPARGRVVMATDRLVTGGTIVLEHRPGFYSLYYHLDTVDVEVGEIVATGTEIATVGSTGLSTGPHLHWEIRISGVAVDPEWFVRTPLVDTGLIPSALSIVP